MGSEQGHSNGQGNTKSNDAGNARMMDKSDHADLFAGGNGRDDKMSGGTSSPFTKDNVRTNGPGSAGSPGPTATSPGSDSVNRGDNNTQSMPGQSAPAGNAGGNAPAPSMSSNSDWGTLTDPSTAAQNQPEPQPPYLGQSLAPDGWGTARAAAKQRLRSGKSD
jgi:hypothetical protein